MTLAYLNYMTLAYTLFRKCTGDFGGFVSLFVFVAFWFLLVCLFVLFCFVYLLSVVCFLFWVLFCFLFEEGGGRWLGLELEGGKNRYAIASRLDHIICMQSIRLSKHLDCQ